MRQLLTILICAAVLCGCAPINRFTRLRKLPREYSENYSISGVKAHKSEAHKRPWMVYSDRVGNAAYVNPGGRIKSADVGFMDTFLVIGRKGDYVRLIRYKAENVKNNRLANHKKAEYVGWMPSARLILSPSAITDIRSGEQDKLLTVIRDTSAVMNPERYLVKADSLRVFGDPDLSRQIATVRMHAIVYALKYSADRRAVLVARTSAISVDKSGEQVVGWVPAVMLEGIGRQVFARTALADGFQQPKPLGYSPVIRPSATDSGYTFTSGVLRPVIDKTENVVFNIDGTGISYARSEEIKRGLRRVNVLFSMEPSANLPGQYPLLLNAVQNLRPFFSGVGESSVYQFGGVVSTGRGMEAVPLTSDFGVLLDGLTALSPSVSDGAGQDLPVWSAMRKVLTLIPDEPGTVNLIIEIGEKGGDQEQAPSSIVKSLSEKNCRLLGWQLYASNEDTYNNYILQLSDMIEGYAEFQVTDKRKVILYADQFCRSNLFRELDKNFFLLDYPYASMTQGGFLFPEKGELLPVESFQAAVDSIVTQIEADRRLLSASIDRAFHTVGNTKDRLDSLFVRTFDLPRGMRPDKEFKKMFEGTSPLWYNTTPGIVMPDSLMDYRLLLSDPELARTKERLETLCAMEVDVRDPGKPKRGKLKSLCRFLANTDCLTDEMMSGPRPEAANDTNRVYVSTRKIRRHLYDFYLSELRNCRVCRASRKEISTYPLSYAHLQIFGVPSNNPLLDTITIGDLRNSKRLPDDKLDSLIRYFKQTKEHFVKESTGEQLTTEGQAYYFMDSGLLP